MRAMSEDTRFDLIRVDRSFSQEDFDAFARLSGDANAIHTDPVFAARSRFGRPVAHGMMLFTILRGLIAKLPNARGLTLWSLTFPAPTYAGEELAFEAWRNHHGDVEARAARIADNVETCLVHAAKGSL